MAGVNDNGQVAVLLNNRNNAEVKRIAGILLKGTNAALTKHHLLVALAHNIFRRHQPFLNGVAKTAFQQHRRFGAPHRFQQVKILHIARPNLNHIHAVFQKLIQLGNAHQLCHDRHLELLPRVAQRFQPLRAAALKSIGRGARLVSAAPQHIRPSPLNRLSRKQQ